MDLANKRTFYKLNNEMRQMREKPSLNFIVGLFFPVTTNDIFNWQGIIVGPEDNHFVEGLFLVTFRFGIEYLVTPLRVMDSKTVGIMIIFHFIYLI